MSTAAPFRLLTPRAVHLQCRIPPPSKSIKHPRLIPSRAFITLPNLGQSSTPQTLTATRTLPYPSSKIYEIIADVPSYSTFLPYCTGSKVTRWSKPDDDKAWGRKWPEEAVLEVGWKNVTERFRSRIYCVPGRIVEAIGGQSETRLAADEIAHHDLRFGRRNGENSTQEEIKQSEILTHLLTRWSVEPVRSQGSGGSSEATKVTLGIQFQFANPVYGAMAGAFADKVAGVMIEAFEKRVQRVMSGVDGIAEPGTMEKAALPSR